MGIKEKRIEYLDIAKGIAMLCVILAHISEIPFLLNRICFSFHMPLFFLISGYLFKIKDERILINQKRVQLLRPYMITGFFVILSSMFWNWIMKNDSITVTRNIMEWLWAIFYGSGNTYTSPYWVKQIGAIWFLPAMFFSLVIFDFCLKRKCPIMWIVSLVWIGYYTRDIVWLPFSIQSSLVVLVYLYIGYKVRIGDVLEKSLRSPIRVCTAFVLWIFYITCGGGRLYIVGNYFGYGVIYEVFFSTIAVFCVIWISFIFSKRKNIIGSFLIFLGKNSLIVLCAHLVELDTVPWWILVDYLIKNGIGQGLAIGLLFCIKALLAIIVVICFNKLKTVIGKKDKVSQDKSIVVYHETKNSNAAWVYLVNTLVIALLIIGQWPIDITVRTIIFSFHLPLLVITYGYCYKKRSVRNFVYTDLKSLFMVYMGVRCCNLVIMVWKELFYYGGNKTTAITIAKKWLEATLAGISFPSDIFRDIYSVEPVWIIICLIYSLLIFTLILRIKVKLLQICAVIGCSLLGVYIGKQELFLSHNISTSLIFVTFLYIGYSLKCYNILDQKLAYKSYILLIIIWLAGIWKDRIGLEIGDYLQDIFNVVSEIAGAVFVIFVSREMTEIDGLKEIGYFVGGNIALALGICSLDTQTCDWMSVLEGSSITMQLLIKIMLYFSLGILLISIKDKIRLKHQNKTL